MASWIIHLRAAQGIQERLRLQCGEAFIMGNIAPDSGVPSPDGSGFIPDAAISHFRTVDANGLKDVHEEQFISRYLSPQRRANYTSREYAFYYGYLTHLLTDKLWARQIAYDARMRFAAMYQEDTSTFWRSIKRDWYDQDFLFLRENPDFPAWRVYTGIAAFENDLVDFFPKDAFMQRRDFIMDFYREGVSSVKMREMYLSAAELDAFVSAAVDDILRITADFADEMIQKGFASPI